MKKILSFLSLFIIMSLACNMSVNTVPTAEAPATEPATTTPEVFISLTQAMPPTETLVLNGVAVSYQPLSLIVPNGLASGISGEQFPRAEGQDIPYWELTPGHTAIKLEGYLLQDKFHEPKFYVYPAQAYAEMHSGAFESMHRLNNVLSGLPVSNEDLPNVPFFNAAQVFASQVKVIQFQNGRGVRFLTEYAQGFVSINNNDLFYHFEGLTDDGAYYIVAVLPVTSPVLAETEDPSAPIPAGGVPFPDLSSANPDMKGYFDSVATLLDAQTPESFSPTINQLDALIQSMKVAP